MAGTTEVYTPLSHDYNLSAGRSTAEMRRPESLQRSEQEAEAEPEIPLVEHPAQRVRSGDLAEPVQVLHRPIGSQLQVRDVGAGRVGEVRGVGSIHCLGANLSREAFGKPECAEHAQIQVVVSRAPKLIKSGG